MPKDLIIDGIRVESDPSKTVIEVAQELGINIPTLCHHKALTPYGACRICIVETIWNGKSKLHTACTYPAWDGEILTKSKSVIKARKMILELMIAEAPEAEDIQLLAAEYGCEDGKYTQHRAGEDNLCIMCGLCVRICMDVMNNGAIGFENRGYKREIVTPFQKNSEICTTCGACEFVCPTNAIKVSDITDRSINPILSEFDVGLQKRSAIFRAFPQAVPNIPLIDKGNCMYFNNDEACGVCDTVCQFNAIDYKMKDEVIDIEAGNIIVATGFKVFDPEKVEQFGYGKYPNVFTSLEFERILNASGPTNGEIVLKTKDENGNWTVSADGKPPKSVAVIHCVGSRDEEHNRYCSKVCCMYSLKLSHLVKEKLPDADVYEYYIDMRAFGKGYEEFFDRINEEDVHIIRGRTAKIEDSNGQLILRSEDINNDNLIEQKADMVILSVGLQAGEDSEQIGKMLGLSIGEEGWFTEANSNSDPVSTLTGGISIAGVCQGPKDIPDTVAQASAAASRVTQSTMKGRIKQSIKNLSLEKIEQKLNQVKKEVKQ